MKSIRFTSLLSAAIGWSLVACHPNSSADSTSPEATILKGPDAQADNGFDVTVSLGQPGEDNIVSRLSASVDIRSKGRSLGRATLLRETTAGREQGGFSVDYRGQVDEDARRNFYVDQLGRVQESNGNKYVDVTLSYVLHSGWGGGANIRTLFLNPPRSNLPPSTLDDYLALGDVGGGMEEVRNLVFTRHASRLGEERSWSSICTTPLLEDGTSPFRICTFRLFNRYAAEGRADSAFLGVIRCGASTERRYFSFSLSFASGDEQPAERMPSDFAPISVTVGGLYTLPVGFEEAEPEMVDSVSPSSKPGRAAPRSRVNPPPFRASIELPEPGLPRRCGQCAAIFAYDRSSIAQDPVLTQVWSLGPPLDGLSWLGREIVEWILDGE